MDAKKIVLLLGALVIAVTTALLARNMFSSSSAPQVNAASMPEADLPHVLVATKALPVGTILDAESFRFQPWPKELIEQVYYLKGQADPAKLAGSVVRNAITAGQPLTQGALIKPGDRGFLAAVLAPGNRAMTVPITATSGNAGFVFPGDMVDLIMTAKLEIEREGEKKETKRDYAATVLTAVRVLAIDQKTENAKGETVVGKTATMEVTPKQAEIVALAMQVGQLALSLRSLATDSPESVDGESVAAASFANPDSQAKTQADQGRSYTMDRELMFMLDGRGQGAKRDVTILRGSEKEQKATATQ